MNEVDLDSFEISIQSDIKSIKPKSKRRGYARQLVEKLHSTIEQALSNGCSYEEIVDVLSSKIVKISSSTLKKYHQANKKINQLSSKQSEDLGNKHSTKTKGSKGSSDLKFRRNQDRANSSRVNSLKKLQVDSQAQKLSDSKEKEHLIPLTQRLSGSSLTDDDYLDDFNDY